jgi:methyl-accepting chemotaxis protein
MLTQTQRAEAAALPTVQPLSNTLHGEMTRREYVANVLRATQPNSYYHRKDDLIGRALDEVQDWIDQVNQLNQEAITMTTQPATTITRPHTVGQARPPIPPEAQAQAKSAALIAVENVERRVITVQHDADAMVMRLDVQEKAIVALREEVQQMRNEINTALYKLQETITAQPAGNIASRGEAGPQKVARDWCPIHACTMHKHTGRNGDVWYSHRDEETGQWCRGNAKK